MLNPLKNPVHTVVLCALFLLSMLHSNAQPQEDFKKKGLASIDTKYTISKVRSMNDGKEPLILSSSYEGTLLGVDYEGGTKWKNKLSGFMNHDLWVDDMDGDGSDEILSANADGSLYCLTAKGKLKWAFKQNDAPMYAVCTIRNGSDVVIVCGGFDKTIYYLNTNGGLLKSIESNSYSVEKAWSSEHSSHKAPEPKQHISNFLRPMTNKEGKEVLVLHGVDNSMNGRGTLYFFEPLADKPYKIEPIKKGKPYGHLSIGDADGDGSSDVLLGASSMLNKSINTVYSTAKEAQVIFQLKFLNKKEVASFGYRVAQNEVIIQDGKPTILTLLGNDIILFSMDEKIKPIEYLGTEYSYNDMWKVEGQNKILLASAQSGGSAVHIIDLDHNGWKKAYESLDPPGKIQKILSNTTKVRDGLKGYDNPNRDPLPVYLMAESLKTPEEKELAAKIKKNYNSPVFLNSAGTGGKAENWDRSEMPNKKYRERRDGRRKYTLTQQEALDYILPRFKGNPGIAYWGGHGNDPFMFQPSTTKKVLDYADGKKTVLIYPELEDHSENFQYVLDNLINPIANYADSRNGIMYLRNKHSFWLGSVYRKDWELLVSGELSNVFVPSMEETSDKSMELSLAGRLGLWASGSVDSWGTRCARDNTSYDRLRQHSHQELPNHFLRNMIYHAAYGAQYMHNFKVDQEYMSLLWELIAKGALYVPKREEILSFSPVHLSMKEPDHDYMEQSTNVKWTTFYNEEEENENPMVFSRLNGSWPGAPVTDWDFSKYAAGQNERRLNFLSTYNNGLVLITPPQQGAFAVDAPRGKLVDHIHPIYKNIMTEFVTDGRSYYSLDGKETYSADEYYTEIATAIEENASKIPVTVNGKVAWVTAQTSPKNIRLTLIDHGYLNPDRREVTINFNTVKPTKIVDILSGEEIQIKKDQAQVTVPLGAFRFIDIQLDQPLK